jgi:hypothetical protein
MNRLTAQSGRELRAGSQRSRPWADPCLPDYRFVNSRWLLAEFAPVTIPLVVRL